MLFRSLVAGILIWAKSSPQGFATLWRYFAWSNQTLSLFAFAGITVWMYENGKQQWCWMPLLPGCFYTFITITYIANAKIGLNIPWNFAYVIGAVAAIAYAAALVRFGGERAKRLPPGKA